MRTDLELSGSLGSRQRSLLWAAIFITACVASVILGYEASTAHWTDGIILAVFSIIIISTLVARVYFTAFAVAVLPWLVMLDVLIPRLTLTFTSAACVILLLSLASGRQSILLWTGIALFALVLLDSAINISTSNQLIEAAKYTLFPAVAFVATTHGGRQTLMRMRPILLYSGLGAMAVQLVFVLLHLGSVDTKYGAGEQLGFASQNPHELALVGTTVAVACLVSIRDIRWRLAAATVAVLPALATGVRSALVAVVISLLVLAIRARFRPSIIFGIAVLCAAIIFSGVGTIIATRYEQDQAKGEFSKVASIGSGRGALWTNALDSWSASGPTGVMLGSGLRSIEQIEAHDLYLRSATGQSDPITILVELGFVGFAGWLLIWLALIRSRINWLVLLPLASYAITNGSLEYVGATVFGIALAGACSASITQRTTFSARECVVPLRPASRSIVP
jgi:hypothetical protein